MDTMRILDKLVDSLDGDANCSKWCYLGAGTYTNALMTRKDYDVTLRFGIIGWYVTDLPMSVRQRIALGRAVKKWKVRERKIAADRAAFNIEKCPSDLNQSPLS